MIVSLGVQKRNFPLPLTDGSSAKHLFPKQEALDLVKHNPHPAKAKTTLVCIVEGGGRSGRTLQFFVATTLPRGTPDEPRTTELNSPCEFGV